MAAAAKAAGTAPPRMSLASIATGAENPPDRILVVGTEGVGKTTFGANAPAPVFLCAEDGIPKDLRRTLKRFPVPESTEDVLAAIRSLLDGEHPFKTLVIDTADWLEPIVWATVCRRNKWLDSEGNPDIERPGYGKGYIAATEEWRRILAALDILRNRRGLEVILLAHAAIKVFQNPAGADYSRYECKLNKGAAALLKEWCDVNLFAVHEEFVTESDPEKRGKGVSTGKRVLKTERCAAWDAKNRHGLPAELPLDYEEYAKARDAGAPADPEALRLEAVELIEQVVKGEAEQKAALAAIEKNKGDAVYLARQVNRLRAKVAQKGAA